MVGFCLVPESKSQPAVEDKKKQIGRCEEELK